MHAEERWEELRQILYDIKARGCDVYAQHRELHEDNIRRGERERIAQEALSQATVEVSPGTEVEIVGRTWPDVIRGISATNIALGLVIVFLVLYTTGGFSVALKFLGLG